MHYLEVEPGSARLREGEPSPLPGGWGRVQVAACGVCGTDLQLLQGMELPRGRAYPVRPGHEVAGRLVEGGDGRIAVGDDVVLHPVLPCGECAVCRSGFENRCRTAGVLGIDHEGGLADEVVWPLSRMVRTAGLPPAEAAVLPDAVASAYHAFRLAELPSGGALTVLGAGGVGAHVVQLARILDPAARLTAVVRSTGTAERLDRLGIGVALVHDLRGSAPRVVEESGPQDAVVEYGAGAAGLAEALPMLARGGRLVVGSVSDERLELSTTLTALVTRELHVVGSYASTLADLEAVVELATSGRLDLSASVSHRVPLARAGEALELLEQRPSGLARIVVLP
jgi:propanol-preferring alcohol dehydrogenase